MFVELPRHHPPSDWLAQRKSGTLPEVVALIVDCHRSVCEVCDAAASGTAADQLFDPKMTTSRVPGVLADWLENAPSTKWKRHSDGLERMTLSDTEACSAWLERRAPTGQDEGWDGAQDSLGIVVAGAISVDGSRRGWGDVLSTCTETSVVRVVSSTPVVLVRTNRPKTTE